MVGTSLFVLIQRIIISTQALSAICGSDTGYQMDSSCRGHFLCAVALNTIAEGTLWKTWG